MTMQAHTVVPGRAGAVQLEQVPEPDERDGPDWTRPRPVDMGNIGL
jgi:hypothetical protein